MRRIVALMALMAMVAVAAPALGAEAKPPKGDGFAESGRADALKAFQRQAGNAPVPAGDQPAVIGTYLWSGRADQDYRPFFEWQLRLKAGSASPSGLRLRIVTLGPAREALITGPWKTCAAPAAGATADVDYRMNCPNFIAYRLELAWGSIQGAWLGIDKVSLPVSLNDAAQVSLVVAVNSNVDYAAERKTATVTWNLWNVGAQPAKNVVLTVRFFDANGKEVAVREQKPIGEVAGNANLEQKAVLPDIPAHAGMSIAVDAADSLFADTGFSGVKDLEVARIHAEGKRLKARVRNGTANDLANVTISIKLLAKDGKQVGSFDIPVAAIAAGAEQDIGSDLGTVGAWSGCDVSWAGEPGDAPKLAKKPPGAQTVPPRIEVDGVAFVTSAIAQQDGKLYLKGEITNRRKQALGNLVATFVVGGAGGETSIEYRCAELAPGEPLAVLLEVPGLSAIERLEMGWKAAAKAQ